jgi:hypothetical protein
MLLIGVDYHPSFQQVAFLDQETGEYGELPLEPARISGSLHAYTYADSSLLQVSS